MKVAQREGVLKWRHLRPKILLGTALFWLITQRELAISNRRFGTTYRSHLQGSSVLGYVPRYESSRMPRLKQHLTI